MKNIGNIVKSLQNIMRKDTGVSGDAQRIEQLGWLIALKILDDKDQELEAMDETGQFQSPIPSNLQWRNWASDDEGMTGDALREFVEKELFSRTAHCTRHGATGSITRNCHPVWKIAHIIGNGCNSPEPS